MALNGLCNLPKFATRRREEISNIDSDYQCVIIYNEIEPYLLNYYRAFYKVLIAILHIKDKYIDLPDLRVPSQI
jgi:hypothetical protein